MFARRYFARRYFAERYYPPRVVEEEVVVRRVQATISIRPALKGASKLRSQIVMRVKEPK